MTKHITDGSWKPGQSGNPKGRPPTGRALTEILRAKGDTVMTVGGEIVTAKEALAGAVWQFVTSGEVWLDGRNLSAQSVSEWANVVKWLYTHIEPPHAAQNEDGEPELIVRVVREDHNG